MKAKLGIATTVLGCAVLLSGSLSCVAVGVVRIPEEQCLTEVEWDRVLVSNLDRDTIMGVIRIDAHCHGTNAARNPRPWWKFWGS